MYVRGKYLYTACLMDHDGMFDGIWAWTLVWISWPGCSGGSIGCGLRFQGFGWFPGFHPGVWCFVSCNSLCPQGLLLAVYDDFTPGSCMKIKIIARRRALSRIWRHAMTFQIGSLDS
jgi:hypothetical protein